MISGYFTRRLALLAVFSSAALLGACGGDDDDQDSGGQTNVRALNLATGTYYGLDRVGATIWQHIQTPASVREIGTALVTQYEVDPDTAKSDLVSFLTEMMHEGLVELVPGEASMS